MTSQLVASIPLFSELTSEQREELAGRMGQRRVVPGDPIFWVGDDGTEFFIIADGRVRLTCPDDAGDEMHIADLGPGQFFGELALLDSGRRSATARAAGEVTLLTLQRDDFRAFLVKHPNVMFQVIAELSRRHRDMLDKLRGVANANEVFKERATTWSRVADLIATVSASKGFVLTHLCVVVFWVAANLILGDKGWDPYPFLFLAMFASLEAIFLSMFVLISQNRQGEKDRIRVDLDYQVNRKAHLEVMGLHEKMDRIEALLDEMKDRDGDGVVSRN